MKKGDQMYNAYEKDIAVVNLYFGDSTSFGKLYCFMPFPFDLSFSGQNHLQKQIK